jgi:hypothetical protein
MERYIAIDKVCAWPNLTQMPDGALIATIFNQPTHGGWEGDVECWASEDDGRLWALRGVPAPHEPTTNRMNVAAGLARDGSLIVLASGWNDRPPVGDYSRPRGADVLRLWTCRSADGGRTWRRSESLYPPTAEDRVIPFGDIVQLADGALGVCLYTWRPTGENSAHFYASTDDGRTWNARAIIQEGNTNETTPVVLSDGRLLVVARTLGDQHMEAFASDDHGHTWQARGPVTLGRQHPGHLLLLRDGRLLLAYGIRNKGLYGVGVRFSTDLGESWEPPQVLVDLEDATDGGYPATAQATDGTLITAYYCRGIPAHQRYHMGVVRWQADA